MTAAAANATTTHATHTITNFGVNQELRLTGALSPAAATIATRERKISSALFRSTSPASAEVTDPFGRLARRDCICGVLVVGAACRACEK
jgi:hypothetical protein